MQRKSEYIALVVLLVVAACLSACSEDTQPAGQGTREPFDYENTLVFDGSSGGTIDFLSDYYCYCDEWESSNVTDYTFHVMGGFHPDSVAAGSPVWWLKVVVDDVVPGEPIDFPNVFIWDQPKDADLFIYDPPGEYSSSADGSSGQITIHRLDCGHGGGIEFSINAVIDSEFHDGGTVTVTGTFVAPLTGPPGSGGN